MKMSKNDDNWGKTLDSDLLCDYLKPYKNCFGLGIDFPIWFDWNTNKSKVMIIGRDPQRSHKDNRLIIGSPFGLANKGGRETSKNKYWKFTEPLLENNRVYITDVYKLYTINSLERKKLKKEKGFHYEILEKEIKAINPNKIITIGKDAQIAVSTIFKNKLENYKNDPYVRLTDSLELFFVPHISNMVLQNFIPIANLFLSIGKLKNNSTFEKIGIQILNEKENLFKK
ncbi:uracil-DNA glycosylase family protein [Tamlana sp. I1]|uniref:uracil-DNA glycosylase family protein n=1 Tax=Tamlana sp. I1 TaxID=2762061 RepID=UPI00188F6879|nr:uracil-DNA glycosylase family protein [Tamlana sp. I1]